MAAIYGWHSNNILLLTTTLYPIDYQESMQITAAPISQTNWWPIPEDFAKTGFAIGNGTLKTIRFDAPEQGPEKAKTSFAIGNGTLKTIRFDAPEQGPEKAKTSFAIGNGTLINRKVEADSPDEKLEITCNIESDSSMTLI